MGSLNKHAKNYALEQKIKLYIANKKEPLCYYFTCENYFNGSVEKCIKCMVSITYSRYFSMQEVKLLTNK